MKNFFLIGLLLVAGASFSAEGDAVVRESCQTNVLHTWEGEFSFCEVSPLLTNDLYVCTFTNVNCEGTLIEVYSCRSNGLVRVFRSDGNIKGVSPVVLQMGVISNYPSSVIWGLWRHPGNGGNRQYVIYEYTNLSMRASSTFEYSETDDRHSWTHVGVDGETVSLTNLDFSANLPLWTNRRTRYNDN